MEERRQKRGTDPGKAVSNDEGHKEVLEGATEEDDDEGEEGRERADDVQSAVGAVAVLLEVEGEELLHALELSSVLDLRLGGLLDLGDGCLHARHCFSLFPQTPSFRACVCHSGLVL